MFLRSHKLAFLFLLLLVPTVFAEPPARKVLANQEVTVLRGDFKELHFLTPEGEDWEFRGNFRSAGGFNDDITFHALSQPQYVRWFSHYNHQAEVRLKQKKEGRFSFKAKPGETYYFVFDNFFSSVSNKRIHFNLELVRVE